jgi:phosphoglycolate phosphatase-like HAD superfamily hydrolase
MSKLNLIQVERDIENELRRAPPPRDPEPIDFAPPGVREQQLPMPEYVKHAEGVSEVGKLSAQVLALEYESAAKEIEEMGTTLKNAAQRCEEMAAAVHTMVAEVNVIAARYREEGRKIFEEIERCTLLTDNVRDLCKELSSKISQPARST